MSETPQTTEDTMTDPKPATERAQVGERFRRACDRRQHTCEHGYRKPDGAILHRRCIICVMEEAIDQLAAAPLPDTEREPEKANGKCSCWIGRGDFGGMSAEREQCAAHGLAVPPVALPLEERVTSVIDEMREVAEEIREEAAYWRKLAGSTGGNTARQLRQDAETDEQRAAVMERWAAALAGKE